MIGNNISSYATEYFNDDRLRDGLAAWLRQKDMVAPTGPPQLEVTHHSTGQPISEPARTGKGGCNKSQGMTYAAEHI